MFHGVEMAGEPALFRGGLHCVQHPRRLPMQCRFSVEAEGMLEDVACLAGWWFQIFFIFTPIEGEMIQFD